MTKPMRMANCIFSMFIACLLFRQTNGQVSDTTANNGLRLNQIQVVGTHNSYHLSPEPKLLELIAAASERAAAAVDYSHAPIVRQLSELGIRQLELDIYADPQGGLFTNPIGKTLIGKTNTDSRMEFNFSSAMSKPGIKVIHSPGFDFATTVPTLIDALKRIQEWSISNPHHVPILILIELKDDVTGPAGVKPRAFDAEMLNSIDAEIRSIVSTDKLLTPDMVRGEFESLRSAILERGWPTLQESRGRIMFAMDNESSVRDLYLEGHPVLQGRVMFTSVDETHPAAAWMKINDPIRDFDRIQTMVAKGYLVRTRADSETRQARSNDATQRDKALASGAQFVSTDYPEPDLRFSEYCVRFESKAVARANPVSHSNASGMARIDLESKE